MDSLTTAVELEAQRRGGSTALHWKGARITLDAINRDANRLARVLLARGLDSEQPVAVLLPRGPSQIVAVLAILKAGGAYVPLDLALPAERIAFVLNDAGCRYVLAAAETPLPPGLGQIRAEYFPFEQLIAESATQPDANLDPIPANRLAYIMYTSGSTGQPKGVEVEHLGLVLMASEGAQIFRELGATRVYQFFTMCFDTWGYEVFMALIGGLELVSEPLGPAQMTPNELFDTLAALEVDAVITTPSYLGGLTRPPLRMPSVVTVCGEACPAELVRRWRPHCVLLNGYGPTEVTVACSIGVIDDIDPPITIGHPYGHCDILILDPQGKPVPQGESGEIVVSGPAIARGYRGQPDLTAERFVPSKSERFPEGRMYRTGDLGRYRCDGQLDFLGRCDEQIQLHGFRIEPGEIEARIGASPEVSGAVVVPVGEGKDRKLVAFVAARVPNFDLDGLRQALVRSLPRQMVPARFVHLEEFPKLMSGKTDRRRLTSMAEELPSTTATGRVADQSSAARGKQETADPLADTWCAALDVSTVTDHSDFFALGGDSVAAAKIICEIEERIGAHVPLRLLYDNPTLGGFRAALDSLSVAPATRTA